MNGKTLSHYIILDELGRGGMGVVFRATDTKLERTVAIKVLPPASVANELDRKQLFREARAAAALHHPNIASVFEIGEAVPSEIPPGSMASPFIVMEYVEGLPLEECILAGNLSLETIGKIAQQIADGLQTAHEKGIIHRDIKSSNVMVTGKLDAKILDFGIARRIGLTKLTSDSSTYGTIAYISPEQARGDWVDHRTDIWSLGILLFEMLTGRLPFGGVYEQAIIYLILNTDPPKPSSLRPDLPPEFDFIIGKCLSKEPDERYQTAAELIVDLKAINYQQKGVRSVVPSPSGFQTRFQELGKWTSYIGIAALALIIGIFGTLVISPSPPSVFSMPSVEFSEDIIHSFSNTYPDSRLVAISPPGTHIAFIDGGFIKIRSVGKLGAAEALPNTFRARGLFFSPDGDRIGFVRPDGMLVTMDIDGSLPSEIAPIGDVYGAHWATDSTIVYARGALGIFAISTREGSRPTSLFQPDSLQDILYTTPQYFPERDLLLYTKLVRDQAKWSDGELMVQDLKRKTERSIWKNVKQGKILSGGYIIGYSNQALFAKRFDLESFNAIGKHQIIVNSVLFSNSYMSDNELYTVPTGDMHLSVSDNGTMIHLKSDVTIERVGLPVWVNRNGQSTPVTNRIGKYFTPAISRNGLKLAMSAQFEGEDFQIYIIDQKTGALNPFVESTAILPVWSPDSDYLYYSKKAQDTGRYDIYKKRSDNKESESIVLTHPPYDLFVTDFTTDGSNKMAIFRNLSRGPRDVFVCDVDSKDVNNCVAVAESDSDERNASFSPDGHYIAFSSARNGVNQVFVAPVSGKGEPTLVTPISGNSPEWSSDGKTIYYYTVGAMMAVDIDPETGNRLSDPRVHFESKWFPNYYLFSDVGRFQLHPDGERFLLFEEVTTEATSGAAIITEVNWFTELQADMAKIE